MCCLGVAQSELDATWQRGRRELDVESSSLEEWLVHGKVGEWSGSDCSTVVVQAVEKSRGNSGICRAQVGG